MKRTLRDAGWVVVFSLLIILAVPWFLWGSETVVGGLPLWLWWHIGWMGLTAFVFYLFTRDAWDRLMGVDNEGPPVRQSAIGEREES